ncbi:MAG: ExbD/TolR family protein [Bacteroidia bacterium]
MADIQSSAPETNSRRSVRRAVRIDMTPMVDLAFLLLTFFVLTAELAKDKTMEVTFPKTSGVTMPVNEDGALTLIPDGSGKNIFWYRGKFDVNVHLSYADVSKDQLTTVLAESKKEAEAKGEKLFVIIKPSEKAKYGTVIDVIDALRMQELNSYAITTISPIETATLLKNGGN